MHSRFPSRGTLVAAIAALVIPPVLASCTDAPTAPVATVSREITHGEIPGGQRALFFLTRGMDRRRFAGRFDATLRPEVVVCTTVPCATPVLGPIGLDAKGPATLTLHRAQQTYVFRWRTRHAHLAPNAVYRVIVRVGNYQLGWADLATGTKQRSLKTLDRREFIPVRVGSTVTLPFRIENGAAFPPDLPGRYESSPTACPNGCFLHGTDVADFWALWGAVQITQTGTVSTGMIWFWAFRPNPPVIPPLPAPGTGPLNTGLPDGSVITEFTWRPDDYSPDCLELWNQGLLWGHWCGSSGGKAGISALYVPFEVLGTLNRLPSYVPPIQ